MGMMYLKFPLPVLTENKYLISFKNLTKFHITFKYIGKYSRKIIGLSRQLYRTYKASLIPAL